MDRLLQDSKNRVGFKMFLTALIFLNCVEKSTWAFKAWEQAHLRPGWPLERDPSAFTQQGSILAGLLRMLLGIRKALPQTARGSDGKLVTTSEDPQVARFFETLDLDRKRTLHAITGIPLTLSQMTLLRLGRPIANSQPSIHGPWSLPFALISSCTTLINLR
jgi:hypothetical protein